MKYGWWYPIDVVRWWATSVWAAEAMTIARSISRGTTSAARFRGARDRTDAMEPCETLRTCRGRVGEDMVGSRIGDEVCRLFPITGACLHDEVRQIHKKLCKTCCRAGSRQRCVFQSVGQRCKARPTLRLETAINQSINRPTFPPRCPVSPRPDYPVVLPETLFHSSSTVRACGSQSVSYSGRTKNGW